MVPESTGFCLCVIMYCPSGFSAGVSRFWMNSFAWFSSSSTVLRGFWMKSCVAWIVEFIPSLVFLAMRRPMESILSPCKLMLRHSVVVAWYSLPPWSIWSVFRLSKLAWHSPSSASINLFFSLLFSILRFGIFSVLRCRTLACCCLSGVSGLFFPYRVRIFCRSIRPVPCASSGL